MRRWGCVSVLFFGFTGLLFVGVLIWLAGVVAIVLGAALAVIVLNRILVGTRYAIRADNRHHRPKGEINQ